MLRRLSLLSLLLLAGCGLRDDDTTRALKVCGDTPTPIVWEQVGSGRGATSIPHPADRSQYELQVQAVTECRRMVLEHFNKDKHP